MFSNAINEDLTYWKKATLPDASTTDKWGRVTSGELPFAAPIQIKGRWEDKLVLVNDPEGQFYRADTIVYVLEDNIEAKDWIFRGTSNETDPKEVDGAREIQMVDISKNINGGKSLTKAVL